MKNPRCVLQRGFFYPVVLKNKSVSPEILVFLEFGNKMELNIRIFFFCHLQCPG
jgi:hypothetical protein